MPTESEMKMAQSKLTSIYDENGNLSPAWYAQQRASLRAFQGANGMWYAATVNADGFHHQGVGRHETAQAALDSARRYYSHDDE